MRVTNVSSETLCRRIRRHPARPSRGSDFVARAKRNVPYQIEFPHPLSWWRTRPAYGFKGLEISIARRFLRDTGIMGEPHWYLGAAGDAAVAIGVAIRIRRQAAPLNLVSLDLAMTAVLCVALEGNAAAALLLSATLKARSTEDPTCVVLSESWLTEEFKKRKHQILAGLPPN